MLKQNLVFVQGYIWNVGCIAHNITLLCDSWSIVIYLGYKSSRKQLMMFWFQGSRMDGNVLIN
jgi:hypothetical protein